MPRQTKVVLSDDGNGQSSTLTVGAFGQSYLNSAFFDRGQNQSQVLSNVGLAFRIGGYVKPNSVEFNVGVNQSGKGLQAQDGHYTIKSVTLADPTANPQTYTVTFQDERGNIFGVATDEGQLGLDYVGDPQPGMLLPNVVAALRLGGYTSLAQVIGGKSGYQYVNGLVLWF